MDTPETHRFEIDAITISAIRHQLGFTSRQLADTLNVHPRSVQDWEAGNSQISFNNAYNLRDLQERFQQRVTNAANIVRSGRPAPIPGYYTRSQRAAFAAAVLDHEPTATFTIEDEPTQPEESHARRHHTFTSDTYARN